jgi:hypothetical protein
MLADGVTPALAGLLRRIHPLQVVPDRNNGTLRPSSAAFKDPSMAVDVEPFLAEQGLDWKFSLKDYPEHSLVRLSAELVAADNFEVITPHSMTTKPTRRCRAKSPSRSQEGGLKLQRGCIWPNRLATVRSDDFSP